MQQNEIGDKNIDLSYFTNISKNDITMKIIVIKEYI